MTIIFCSSLEQPGWLPLRQALWPDGPAEDHLAEMATLLAQPERYAQWVAYAAPGQAAGFVEAALRSDYVNGTSSSPVGFIEGIYVAPEYRRQGVGAALVAAVASWAAAAGCSELASDAALDNAASHALHRALGFEETERVVYFRMDLDGQAGA